MEIESPPGKQSSIQKALNERMQTLIGQDIRVDQQQTLTELIMRNDASKSKFILSRAFGIPGLSLFDIATMDHKDLEAYVDAVEDMGGVDLLGS